MIQLPPIKMFGAPECLGDRDEKVLSQSAFSAMCDVTASTAGAVCGLDERYCRYAWLEVRLGLRKAKWTREDAVALKIMELGQDEQPLAEREYIGCSELFDSENESYYGETRWTRMAGVYKIGATPDMMILDKHTLAPKRLVEIKTLQFTDPISDDLNAKRGTMLKWKHVVQCIIQMFCTGVERTHLFYYRASTGRYWCWTVTSNDELFNSFVMPWLAEVLCIRSKEDLSVFPKKMPGSEALYRRQVLCAYFMK